MRGITFIELLLVVTIISLLLVFTVPLGIDFYRRQQLDVITESVVQALRRAQLQSMSQAEYSFGVYFGSGQTGQYVLYRGDSYGSHDDEEVFNISSSISFGGLSEVNFSTLLGTTTAVGDVTLTDGGDTRTININERGRINYEW